MVAAGRGQYSKALRLYLEQMTVQEIQYTDHEWSGVWTDLSFVNRTATNEGCKVIGGGGLSKGIMRTHESAHKLWTATP